jgi:hypothetical protein
MLGINDPSVSFRGGVMHGEVKVTEARVDKETGIVTWAITLAARSGEKNGN